MMPGVTHLPVASTTVTPAGASIPRPTAAILPSRSRTEPPSIRSPTAVRIVALVIRTGVEGSGA